MKIKKIISFAVTICLIFNVFAFSSVVFADEKAENTVVSEKVYSFLKGMDIVKTDDKVEANNVLTRGAFAVYAARLLGETALAGAEQYYEDIKAGSYCFKEVSLLVKTGVLSVPSNRRFEPDRDITYAEACKILVCILGYKDYAEVTGGYPMGYIKAAKKIGVVNNLTGVDMTVENAYNMLFDACHADLLEITSVSSDDSVEWCQTGNTLLSVSRNIYKIEGIVDKTEYNSLIDFSYADPDTICVDNLVLHTGNFDMADEIGQNLEIYYKKTKDSDRGTVVYYYNESTQLKIAAEDIAGFSNNRLGYYSEKSDKVRYVNIDNNVPVIKNGRLVTVKRSEAINNLKYGYIVLTIDNNDDCIAVNVRAEETFIVKELDFTDKIVYDKYKGNDLIDCGKDTERVLIYDAGTGNPISVELIDRGTVVTAYRSDDKKLVELYVMKSSVMGSVTSILSNDIIVVDNTEYKINKEMKDKGYLKLKTGMTGDFRLDINGAVCDFIPTSDMNMYGYICDSHVKEGSFETDAKLKVFTATGEHKVFDLASTVRIDNQTYKTAAEVVARLMETGDVETIKQLVRYRLNSAGEINFIDTAALSEKEAETVGSLVATTKYTGQITPYYWITNTQKSSFYPEPVLDRDTKIFIVPDEYNTLAEDFNYVVTDYNWFSQNLNAKMSAYKVDFSHPFAEAVVLRLDRTQSLSVLNYPFMVDEETQELNDQGEVRRVIYGYQAETRVAVPIAPYYDANVPELGRGDIIRVAKDYNGEVCDFEMFLDYSANKDGLHRPEWFGESNVVLNGKQLAGESDGVTASTNMTFGHVIDKWYNYEHNVHAVRPDSPGLILKIGYSDTVNVDRTINCYRQPIIIYDTVNDKIYKGAETDVDSYTHTEKGSDVYIFSRYYGVNTVYLYKN